MWRHTEAFRVPMNDSPSPWAATIVTVATAAVRTPPAQTMAQPTRTHARCRSPATAIAPASSRSAASGKSQDRVAQKCAHEAILAPDGLPG